MSKRAICFLLLMASGLYGEGSVKFENHIPLQPHTMIRLTKAQLKLVQKTSFNLGGSKPVKTLILKLAPEQKEVLRKEAGKSVAWVEARSQAAFEGECTCGDANTAVLYEKRIAVLHNFLEPDLTLKEYQNR